MQLPNQLTALFLPTRRLLGNEAPELQRGGVLGPQQWVVPRAQCHYRRLDLSKLPLRQREAAARVAARRHDPVPDARHYIAWKGGNAHLWIWPPADDFSLPADQEWIPESALRPPPEVDGARLLKQEQGYEGQLWRDREPVATRWWQQAPDLDEWRHFLRAGGFAAGADAVPAAESLPWSPSPWGTSRRSLPTSPAMLERLGWLAVGCIVALGLGWQLAGLVRWNVSLAQVEGRTEALRAQATPLLEARERADLALQQLQAYQELKGGVSDYAVMAEVLQPLPADARLHSWLRDATRLQSGVRSANSDPRHYVSAYDGHARLTDVMASPSADGTGMDLAFEVLPVPASTPAATGGNP